MEAKQVFKGWYQLTYSYDSRIKVEKTLQSFLGRKHQGLFKVYCPINRDIREKIFYFAIEGIEFYNRLVCLFPLLIPCEAPKKSEVSRIIGSQQERAWMFCSERIEANEGVVNKKVRSRKARLLNLALKEQS